MAIKVFNDSYIAAYCVVLSFSVIMSATEHDVGSRHELQTVATIIP